MSSRARSWSSVSTALLQCDKGGKHLQRMCPPDNPSAGCGRRPRPVVPASGPMSPMHSCRVGPAVQSWTSGTESAQAFPAYLAPFSLHTLLPILLHGCCSSTSEWRVSLRNGVITRKHELACATSQTCNCQLFASGRRPHHASSCRATAEADAGGAAAHHPCKPQAPIRSRLSPGGGLEGCCCCCLHANSTSCGQQMD